MKKIKAALLIILCFAKDSFQDLMLIIGFFSVVYGISLMHKPASFVVAGLLLLIAFVPKTGKKPGPQ